MRESGSVYISIDALPAPAFICDDGGVVKSWNHAIETLTGWPASSTINQRLVDVVVPPELRALMHAALITSTTAGTLLRVQTPEKKLLEIHFRVTNLTDGAAGEGSRLAVGVDVTTLMNKAAAASQEVHDLKRLIDCANAPIFGINATALITEWNRKATQITGRSKWEVVGRRLEEFIRPEDRPSVVEVLDNALKGKETANFEFPLYTKAGTKGKEASERVEILLNAATRRDANNEIVGVVGVGQDITELNAGKAELARVANDLKMLIESANAPIFGIDVNGLITEWNKKAAEITGYTAQEMLGHTLVDAAAIKEEFKGSVRQVLTHALNGIESNNFELPLYSRSGTRVELSLNATTRHSAKGEVVGVVMVGQDITGKKDIEKAQIAAAKARAASDAKGKFMASMSHEMRTPLNGVLGMLQLALELDLPPKGLKFVQNAMMSAQHLMNLVNDILDISKIEAGRLELEQRVLNLHEVLHAAVEIVKVNAVNKRLRIDIDIDPSLPTFVVGDQQRLRQVLLNLLFNAVKFTPQGRIVVTAALQQEFANHMRLQLAVEDTGIGIREEDMQRLFGLFTKIRDKRVENPLGAGLGLAICKQLVELMRGQIHVASEYGRGTKFYFTVLVGRAGSTEVEAFEQQENQQRATAELAMQADISGKTVGRVLVVEDNEFNIEVVRCMLENAGHTVGMAMNGQDGLDAWRLAREQGKEYDLILMDCNMPLMDGYEATRRIRTQLAEETSDESHPAYRESTHPEDVRLPIIALTAYAMPGDKEKCLNAGMSDYITKPVNRDVLLNTVIRHMRLHWSRTGREGSSGGGGGGGGQVEQSRHGPTGGGGGGGGHLPASSRRDHTRFDVRPDRQSLMPMQAGGGYGPGGGGGGGDQKDTGRSGHGRGGDAHVLIPHHSTHAADPLLMVQQQAAAEQAARW